MSDGEMRPDEAVKRAVELMMEASDILKRAESWEADQGVRVILQDAGQVVGVASGHVSLLLNDLTAVLP